MKRFERSRLIISGFLFCLMILSGGGALVTVLAADKTDKKASKETQSEASRAPAQQSMPTAAKEAPATDTAVATALLRDQGPNCIVDPSALEDMKIKREELQTKAKLLEEKEAELSSRERALAEQLARLQEVRDEIATLDDARKKENDEKVGKLVETMETMSAKAAAQMLGSVDEKLAVAAAGRMSTLKLAKIMNVMESGKSSRLAEALAGVVRARRVSHPDEASNGAPVATASPGKGGDRNDGNSQQQQQQQSHSAAREPGSANSAKK